MIVIAFRCNISSKRARRIINITKAKTKSLTKNKLPCPKNKSWKNINNPKINFGKKSCIAFKKNCIYYYAKIKASHMK